MSNGQKTGNRLSMMKQKKNENIVAKHMFMLKYPSDKYAPFCIVEGEDEKYYKIRVQMRCNAKPIFISCGGKKKVKDMYEWIEKNSKYRDCKVMFFVDRDFDELYNNPAIYETPFHSVENFYTTIETITDILCTTFKFTEETEHFQRAKELFIARQKEFHEHIKFLNAWIMCQKDLEKSGQFSILNLNNVDIKDFVVVSLDSVQCKYTSEIFEEKFPNAFKIPEQKIMEKLKEIEGKDYQGIFRGKFEVQFARKFLDLLCKDACKPKPEFLPAKKKINLNIYDMIDQFSSNATTTQCLFNYIDRIWNRKITIQSDEKKLSSVHI
ncbi:DUF4435 domain-containing protein [Bacillus cereus]|uniref:DUF4435 domain-containing protein n=1 Tax=Bacillus cereus group sp. BfR-BA-01358 TaxID=2920320 RepID=UPI001F571AC8|nr:DUF4435 domain-containing protein [Bacillus cereus group sp. BfR-BA-01358]MDA1612193.1 DUF4435 domain-containing protein [Bacillus cereus]MDA2617907.1 DUF4435 domain-containing protein [Bacillus cereus]